MTVSRPAIRIFFDASCLVAAARSPSGGAALVLAECRTGKLRAVASLGSITEARRNIAAKLGDAEMARLVSWLQSRMFRIVDPPKATTAAEWQEVVNPKDWHIVRAALFAHCTYLMTFDRPLAAEVNSAKLSLAARLPGEIIAQVIHQVGSK